MKDAKARGLDFWNKAKSKYNIKSKDEFMGPLPADGKKGALEKIKDGFFAAKTKASEKLAEARENSKDKKFDRFFNWLKQEGQEEVQEQEPNKKSKVAYNTDKRNRKTKQQLKREELQEKESTSTLDKAKRLKERNQAAQQKHQGAKTGIKGILGKGLGKVKGFGGVLGGLVSSVAGSLASGEEGQETEGQKPNRSILQKAGDALAALKKKKGTVAQDKRASNDKDGDGVADNSVEDVKNKQDALKESRKKDFLEADLTNRYAGKGGLGGLLSMVMNMMGTISKGVGSLFRLGSGFISKLPGFANIVRGVGSLLPSAGTVGRLAWGAARFGIGTAARAAIWTAATAIPAVASAVTSVATTAFGVIGATIGWPVVLGALVIGGAAYGLYKLYKHAHRNDATDLEKLRLRQYGFAFNTQVEGENHRLFTLEAYLQDGKVGYDRDKKPYLIEKNIKAEEIAALFSVEKDDKEHAEKFAGWFKERFKPVFLTHLAALYQANPKLKLDQTKELTPEQAMKYVELATFESGPYNYDISPLKTVDALSVDKDAIMMHAKNLLDFYKEKVKKSGKETKLPPKINKTDDKGKTNDQAQKLKEDEDKRLSEERKKVEEKNSTLNLGLGNGFSDSDGSMADKVDKVDALKEPTGGVSNNNIPIAPGAPRSGEGGSQFIKLQNPSIQLDGVNQSIMKLFSGMAEEFGEKTGKGILVTSGYRSYEQQKKLHDQDPSKAAKPGRSMHEFGLAMDINSADANELEKLGLMKKYGFTRPIGGEPWHIEPAGFQKNIQEAKSNPTVREMMIQASITRGGGGYGTVPGSTKGKRNTDMAIGLLDLPGKDVKDTKDEPMKVGGLTLPAGTPLDKKAANDDSAKPKPLAPVQDKNPATEQTVFNKAKPADSNNKKLPTQEELDFKAAAAKEAEAKPSDAEGKTTAASAKSGDIKSIITYNAKRAGANPDMILAFAATESDMNPNAKAPNTSASGLFQFLGSTWQEQISKHGAKYSLPKNASPFDPEAATLMASEYVKQNTRSISGVKSDINTTDAYLTHFLGAAGAKKFLSSNPSQLGTEIFPSQAAKNRNIFYSESGTALTIKQIYDGLSKKIDAKADIYGINAPVGSFKSIENALPQSQSGGSRMTTGQPQTGPVQTQATASPSAKPAPFTNGAELTKPAPVMKEMVAESKNKGIFVDTRNTSERSRASGEGATTMSLVGVETRLDESNKLQKENLEILKNILDNVKTDKVATALAEAIGAVMKTVASNDKETLKEKDEVRMGRKSTQGPSSVDFSRRSA